MKIVDRKPKPPLIKLNNGCIADEFPHEYGCRCPECDAVWENLQAEEETNQLEMVHGKVIRYPKVTK